MASYSGSTPTIPNDGSLQLAPTGSKGPNFGELKNAFEKVLSDSQSFVDQTRQNYQVRFALWNSQSADGKKHAREGAKIDPTPWDGASDLRVYLVDDAINKKAALYRMAFKKANLAAVPVTGNDTKRARIVSNFMKWLVHTQIQEVDREIELLANYILEKGVGAMGQFWETQQEKTLVTLSVQELQQKFPDIDVVAAMLDPDAAEQMAIMFTEQYGCTMAKAKKMIAELSDPEGNGKTTVAALGREISRPVLRAFDLAEQLFIPPFTTDLEKATGIWRVEYFTPEALRAMVRSDGWDEAWVEKAIETCRGKIIQLSPSEYLQPINRSFVYQQQKFTDQIGVVYGYQRMSDEDGVPGIYLTIFNPMLPPDSAQDGYAKFSLLPYAHGKYPFVLFRREYLSRRLHDTRGLPEPGKPWQDAIKAHKDSRIDAASIAIIPPIGFPMGRPPSRWGPGARIPERRPGEYHFLDRPAPDGLTEQSETLLREDFKGYCGFNSKDSDPQYNQAQTQNEIDKFLTGLSASFGQVYSLYCQYGDERVFFRVVGLQQPDLSVFDKGDRNENYDFYMSFDVQSMDAEQMQMKWKAIFDGIQLLNRDGNVNFSLTLQKYLESIDPNVAESILEPTQMAQDRIMKEEADDLTKIFAGFNVNVKPTTPPQLGLQVMQIYMQSPDVQQRYQTDQAFRARMDARAKQYRQGELQEKNKIIGAQGAIMPGPSMPN